MTRRFAMLAALIALFSAPALHAHEVAPPVPEKNAPALEYVVLETTRGDIKLALEVERAPITAANFLRYVEEDRFDGTVFYRAMRLDWGEGRNGLIQGGTQNDPERILEPIAHEPTTQTGIEHEVGTISMARFAPGTATGDFTITLSPMPGLDANPGADNPDLHDGFAAFGRVVEGMDVVRAIFDAPLDPDAGEGWMKGQMLAEPVTITTARRIESADAESE